MSAYGMEKNFSLLVDGQAVAGHERGELLARVAGADVLFNVMGYLADAELLRAARRRVFVDIDPGFGQMWEELGLATMFVGHHHYVTVGLNIARPTCRIPTRGIDWITTPPPVSLAEWPSSRPGPAGMTTVASWRGPNAPIEFGGEMFGLRAHQFRRFLGVPAATGAAIELALDIDAADHDDVQRLHAAGFRLVDPLVCAGDPDAFRAYVTRSSAEFCVAKDLYVRSVSGWFSDRSACYLAAGRPVLHQETGFSNHLPTGEGLLSFCDPPGAVDALCRIAAEPEAHSMAARQIAERHFDATKVIGRVLERVGVR
jgi:hypothetical protein